MTAAEFVVVLVTTATADEAADMARALVEERLAACANVIGPIRSLFRWEGKVDDATEHLLLVKARAADFALLEGRVRALHSYEVPEVIALPAPERLVRSRVTLIDRAAREIHCSDGSVTAYDTLVLATGSNPVLPPLRGQDRVDYEGLWKERLEKFEPWFADSWNHPPGDAVWDERRIDARRINVPALCVAARGF